MKERVLPTVLLSFLLGVVVADEATKANNNMSYMHVSRCVMGHIAALV